MSGFGASILLHIPKTSPGLSAKGIQAGFDGACHRAPSLSTIREHLRRMEALGLVQRVRQGQEVRYFRLVDSVFDEPLGAEA